MDDSKALKSDRELVLRDERNKEALEGGMGDLTLGGRREKVLVRKLDLHLIPLVMLLYTFSFLDRYVIIVRIFPPFVTNVAVYSSHVKY